MSLKPEPGLLPRGEPAVLPLCLSCTAPSDPFAHFCSKCGAPLDSYAATGPFEHIFAAGFVLRKAAERPRNLVIVIGVWLILGAVALPGLVSLIQVVANRRISQAMMGALISAVTIGLLWRITRNYFANISSKKSDID